MQDPVRYESNKSSAKEIVDVFVPKLINTLEWKTEENVLDYGCGAGSPGYQYILPKVQHFKSKMYSVDVSSKMLSHAMEHYPHELITYGVGDILGKFPFENVKFDKIISVNVFHYIKDIRKALAGFYKILKPSGQLGFIMVPANHITFQAFKELAKSNNWKLHMKNYKNFYPEWSEFAEGEEHKEMQELLASSGFLVLEMEVLQRNYYFDSWNTVLEIVSSLNPCIDDIPKSLHADFKEDIRKYFSSFDGVCLHTQGLDIPYQMLWGVIEKVKNIEKLV